MEVTYYQVSEFIVHEFIKYLIEMKYGITAKPNTSGNSMSNAILERNNQVLGNLLRTCNITQHCVDKDDSWSRILSAAAFVIISTTDRLKAYIPGQLIFGRDIILPIKRTMDWE